MSIGQEGSTGGSMKSAGIRYEKVRYYNNRLALRQGKTHAGCNNDISGMRSLSRAIPRAVQWPLKRNPSIPLS